MAIKVCRICGKEFEAGGNDKICPNCHTVKCCVCGKDIKLNSYGVTQMIERGWMTCGGKCRAEMTRRGLMEREGITNVSQRKDRKTKTKQCEICGSDFETAGNGRVCDACHIVTCPVCGKEFRPKPPAFSKYRKQGWLTCSQKCAKVMTRRNLEKNEGITNVSQRPDVRRKLRDVRLRDSQETKDKRAAALRASCSQSEVIERRKATNFERYGRETILQDPDVHARAVELAKLPDAKNRRVETNTERYGVSNTFQIAAVRERLFSMRGEQTDAVKLRIAEHISANPTHTPKMVADALDMNYYTLMAYNRRFNLGLPLRISFGERAFAELLEDRGVAYGKEFCFEKRYRFDFVVGKTFIEIDPWPYHNSTNSPRNIGKEPKTPNYHLLKSKHAWEHGYHCIHIFDWDDQDKIADTLMGRVSAGARTFDVVRFADSFGEVNEFLSVHHLQGSCRGAVVGYALCSGSYIAAAMTFGNSRFSDRYEWELLRYCVTPGLSIAGGAERMFRAFVRDFAPSSIVSYCDNAKFRGDIYARLGFERESAGQPSAHWYNPKTEQHFTDAYVNKLGVDKLLGTNYGKGANNKELMIKEGFVAVYDCGQSRFVWRKN